MKEHKLKQILFNRLGSFDDGLNQLTYRLVSSDQEIVTHATAYFTGPVDELIYPAKSYAVAIIYSHLLEKRFKDNFYESLSDPDLFCGNDKFFVTYKDSPLIYDMILERIGYNDEFTLNMKFPQIAKSVKYFEQEFSFDATLD